MEERLVAALQPVIAVLGGTLVKLEDMGPADIPVSWDGQVVAGVRPPDLHGALRRAIVTVERELGGPLDRLSRVDKQRAVQLLESRGAFSFRKSVEDVAEALGVSRFTVYNYINRPGPTPGG
ncbi:MAG: helix-turn-helix domain-containing protein [Acidimicrobiales bacterium]